MARPVPGGHLLIREVLLDFIDDPNVISQGGSSGIRGCRVPLPQLGA
jgi:hypothetical protein